MVVLLVFASIIGCALAFIALLPLGWLAAMIGAPIAGSSLAVTIAVILARRRHPAPVRDESSALQLDLTA